MAQQVKSDDPRLHALRRQFASPNGYGTAQGYLVRPAEAKGPLPTVLVVHENRGLNPHIEDVARRVALDGYLAPVWTQRTQEGCVRFCWLPPDRFSVFWSTPEQRMRSFSR